MLQAPAYVVTVTSNQYVESRTGLLLFVDTNLIGSHDAEVRDLVRLHQEGWIRLQRTDTVDTELVTKSDPDRKAELLGESAAFVESLGVFVLDHSRLDHAVLGGSADETRLDLVFKTLFPNAERGGNNLRDAMHVSTALKYGADGFVTHDKRVLKRRIAIREMFDGFLLLSPGEALAIGRRFARRAASRGDSADR
jgi:hypothetical protein